MTPPVCLLCMCPSWGYYLLQSIGCLRTQTHTLATVMFIPTCWVFSSLSIIYSCGIGQWYAASCCLFEWTFWRHYFYSKQSTLYGAWQIVYLLELLSRSSPYLTLKSPCNQGKIMLTLVILSLPLGFCSIRDCHIYSRFIPFLLV